MLLDCIVINLDELYSCGEENFESLMEEVEKSGRQQVDTERDASGNKDIISQGKWNS